MPVSLMTALLHATTVDWANFVRSGQSHAHLSYFLPLPFPGDESAVSRNRPISLPATSPIFRCGGFWMMTTLAPRGLSSTSSPYSRPRAFNDANQIPLERKTVISRDPNRQSSNLAGS